MKNHLISLLVLVLLVSSSLVGVSSQVAVDTSSDGGLQDSAWPMFHHDTKHTGRSPYGALGNYVVLKWQVFLNEFGGTISSPAIDINGILYLGQNDKEFLALNPNGTVKWRYNVGGWIQSSPAIGSVGTIYFGADNGNFYALNSNGSLKWSVDLGDGWAYASPTIDENGVIYAASTISCKLYAIYPNGTIKWSYQTDGWIYSSPALAEDGTLYIGSNDGYLYSINENGTLKWRFSTGREVQSPPSIALDGTIYFGSWDGFLYALYPNGTLKWKYDTGRATETSPAISPSGEIIIGSYGGKICCINPDGTLKWSFQTNDDIFSSPAIDKNNLIYCGSYDGYLYCFNLNGTLRWKYLTYGGIQSSPVINQEGIVFIGSYNYFYALQMINDTAPSIPAVTGTEIGRVRRQHDYTIVSTDPEDDNISYYIDWGDGKTTDWIGPYDSGAEIIQSHTWLIQGTYEVKVKARDGHGMESDWGILSITMPYEPQFQFIQWLSERFPNAFPILRYLIGCYE